MARKSKTPKADATPETPAAPVADGIKKCPVCSAEHAAADLKCPACGFEYGTAGVQVIETIEVEPSIVKEGRNARVVAEANYLDTVTARAIDIALNGQINAVEAYRVDGHLTLISGFTRKAAVELIRTGFEAVHPITGEKVLFHRPEQTLRVSVVDITPEQAFLRGISENIARKDTTDLQEAEAQAILRDEYGWTDARISRYYGYTNQNRVAKLRQLLTLDVKTQNLVHEGKLALHVALEAAEVSPEERAAIFDACTASDKVRGELVRAALRDLYEAKAEAARKVEPKPVATPDADSDTPAVPTGTEAKAAAGAGKGPKKPPRTKSEFKQWLSDTAAREDVQAKPSVLDLLGTIGLWLDGERVTATLNAKFEAVFEQIKK
jgi:ParB-like chromosome segregation protein Spo0J